MFFPRLLHVLVCCIGDHFIEITPNRGVGNPRKHESHEDYFETELDEPTEQRFVVVSEVHAHFPNLLVPFSDFPRSLVQNV